MIRVSMVTLVVALLGRLAAAQGADSVVPLDSAQVAAAFAVGRPLLETAAYKVHASRRDGPGKVEIHTRDTDIIYVLQGQATFVTGGVLQDGQTIAPNEIRGATLTGGRTRTLRPGDVIVVPNGTPHWFTSVQAPLLYYTVKVTAPGGS